MPVRRFSAAFVLLCLFLAANPATGERVLLDSPQLERLFQGGIVFSYWTGRGTVTFTFRDDRTWSSVNAKGGQAWGNWQIRNKTVCWEQDGISGYWPESKKSSGCFGVRREESDLYIGRHEYPVTLDDDSVLARLNRDTTTPSASPASKPIRLLSQDQVANLFGDGIVYSIPGTKTNMTFTYRGDGTWSVNTEKGGNAWGTWKFADRKICRKETGHSTGWRGLNSKSICFPIRTDGADYFIGQKLRRMAIQDSPARTAPQSVAQSELEKQKRELERQKLALERERQKLAREKAALLQSRSAAEAKPAQVPNIAFGAYHAIVIGINDYTNLPQLKTAIADARAVAKTLEDDYGYTVHLLENPGRGDIIDKFDELRDSLEETDNLLIYYAGHGWLDEQSGRGYWLPVDARENRRSRWLSNATLTDALHAMFAKHVMIVADSCFSGTLTRSLNLPDRQPNYIERIAEKRVRVVLSSGGLEPVIDSGGGAHSIFAAQFLKALHDNKGVMDGTQLFGKIRKNVILNADQTPEYSDIRKAGHEGGDFLFVRKKQPDR